MGTYFTFYDYLNGRGCNVVLSWLRNKKVPADVRPKFDWTIRHLENTHKSNWSLPYVRSLKGDCNGLQEIRVVGVKTHYRLLFCDGPGEAKPTLLYGFKKSDDNYHAECGQAFNRMEDLYGPRGDKYRVKHRWHGD